MIQAKLKIEIMAGYLVLVSCFVFIICLVHEERGKKSAMEQQELHWQGERQQTNQAFLRLLDLASTGELIAGWTEEDYAAYQKKRTTTVALLQNLKAGQEDSLQRACIDSVCHLLVEKEAQKEPAPAGTSGTKPMGVKPSALLYSIEKEIDNATHTYEETLSAKMDSLRLNNRILNRHINLLVQHFEQNERETFCREIRWQQETRNHTFRLIADIGIGGFVLVILLYTGRNKPNLSIFRLETLLNEIAQNYDSLAEKRKLRLDFPLFRLRELVTNPAAEWTDGQSVEIREVIRAVEKLIEYAEKIQKESL